MSSAAILEMPSLGRGSSESVSKVRRTNGEGCVVQRGNRFQISYYDGAGKRRRESYKTREKAEKELAYKIKLREKGKLDEAESRITVDALADLYVTKCRGTAPKSIDWIELVWRVHLKPFFGGFRASRINTEKILQ
jgi:hypothetical protein